MKSADTSPYVAVASSDGTRVDRHLGEADYLLVYNVASPKPELVGLRRIPPLTSEGSRWATLADILQDCALLLADGVGPVPRAVLKQNGIRVRTARGRITEILAQIDVAAVDDDDVPVVCSERCHGHGRGCGCGDG